MSGISMATGTTSLTVRYFYGDGSYIVSNSVYRWPALWTKGHNWPNDGEIEYVDSILFTPESLNYHSNTIAHSSIIEGINLASTNQMALHTKPGCMHVSPAPADQRGISGQLNCSMYAGCTVMETAPNSIGAGFNGAGGGIYATQFDISG
jgi:hypothetical protein